MSKQAKIEEVIRELAANNPGAYRAISEVIAHGQVGAIALAACRHMKITGSKLWVAYKDFAIEDAAALIDALIGQDPELLTFVNAAVDKGWCGDVGHAITLVQATAIWEAKQKDKSQS